MSSRRSYLLFSLLSIFQLALPVYAKGGGKGGSKGSKGSKSKSSKSKSKPKSKTETVVYQENGKCYNEQHVQIPCQSNKTALIVAIVIGVICALLLIVAVALYFRSRMKKKKQKSGKSLGAESKSIHDDSGETDSIAPLVRGESKETDSLYSYEEKSASV